MVVDFVLNIYHIYSQTIAQKQIEAKYENLFMTINVPILLKTTDI